MSCVESFVRFCESDFGKAVIERGAKYVREQLPGDGITLDLGCGIGSFEERLRSLEPVGLDIDRAMLREARNRTSVSLVEGDARSLPFSGASFRKVFTIATLEFIGDVEQVLHETIRVLKPNGRFLALFLNTRSNYVRRHLNREESYFQNMVHRKSTELADEIAQQFETSTEYFLGIDGESIYETDSPEQAAILAVQGTPRSPQDTVK